MSESSSPNPGSTEAEIVDKPIQRMWDCYAMPDHSFDPDSLSTSRVSSSLGTSTQKFVTKSAFDTTTPYDDLASQKQFGLIHEDVGAGDDCGTD